jgi:hypothetical protein
LRTSGYAHKCEVPTALSEGPLSGATPKTLFALSSSHFDPIQTSISTRSGDNRRGRWARVAIWQHSFGIHRENTIAICSLTRTPNFSLN